MPFVYTLSGGKVYAPVAGDVPSGSFRPSTVHSSSLEPEALLQAPRIPGTQSLYGAENGKMINFHMFLLGQLVKEKLQMNPNNFFFYKNCTNCLTLTFSAFLIQ